MKVLVIVAVVVRIAVLPLHVLLFSVVAAAAKEKQFAEQLQQLTKADVSTVQGGAVLYVLYGDNQVMVRSSRVNVFKTHQLFVL